MSLQADILTHTLGLPPDEAEGLVRAIAHVASHMAGGTISIHAMMNETHRPPDFLKEALGVLLLSGELRARFLPYHVSCDKEIGPDESSVEIIKEKANSAEYPRLCPNCHEYIDSAEDIVTRILFSFPREDA